MTTTVDGNELRLFVNNPDPVTPWDSTWTFTLTSEYSQTPLIDSSNTIFLTTENERYLEFTVGVPATFKDKHTNGYYSWTLGPYNGFVKLITQPGGDLGTTDYVSNNEERESTVYYRPNY